jgi:hypothetical protein
MDMISKDSIEEANRGNNDLLSSPPCMLFLILPVQDSMPEGTPSR